jgi:peptidoglycan hydrolase-like protein with peptidoglycan-binding domain
MSTHSQTMKKSTPSRALTPAVAAVLVLAVVLITLAATHVFDHHSATPSASQASGQVTPNGSAASGGSQGHLAPSGPSGSHSATPSAAVKTLQQELAQLNYYEGPIDGIMGAQTVAAIQDLQRQAGLAQTGTMNSATEAALHNYLIHGNSQMNPPPDPSSNPKPTPSYSATVATLQKQLSQLNYYEGPVNGIAGPQTTQAITFLQRQAGLAQTGQMNAATQAALNNYLIHGNNQMAG